MAEPEKRCPHCGAEIPEGFSYCPACLVIRDDEQPEKIPVSRAAYLRNVIIVSTVVLVIVLMIFILPKLAGGPVVTPIAETVTETATGEEPDAASPVSSEVPAETEEAPTTAGATVDTVVAAPGEDGHTHLYVLTKTNPATCTKEGAATYVCSACGDTITRAVPAAGHTWKAATCTAPRTCATCGATEGTVLPHTLVNGVCTVCGFNQLKQDEIDAEEARYKAEKDALEADCQAQIAEHRKAIQDDVATMQSLSGEIERLTKRIAEEMDESEKEKLTNDKAAKEKQYNELGLFVDPHLNAIEDLEAGLTAALQTAAADHAAKLQAIDAKY